MEKKNCITEHHFIFFAIDADFIQCQLRSKTIVDEKNS